MSDSEAMQTTGHRILRLASGKRLLALHAGHVTGMTEDVPGPYIQLERALLLAHVLEAVQTQEPGLHRLSPEMLQFLEARYRAHLARHGLSAEQPDLRIARRVHQRLRTAA